MELGALIKKLQSLKKKHGSIEVYIDVDGFGAENFDFKTDPCFDVTIKQKRLMNLDTNKLERKPSKVAVIGPD